MHLLQLIIISILEVQILGLRWFCKMCYDAQIAITSLLESSFDSILHLENQPTKTR